MTSSRHPIVRANPAIQNTRWWRPGSTSCAICRSPIIRSSSNTGATELGPHAAINTDFFSDIDPKQPSRHAVANVRFAPRSRPLIWQRSSPKADISEVGHVGTLRHQRTLVPVGQADIRRHYRYPPPEGWPRAETSGDCVLRSPGSGPLPQERTARQRPCRAAGSYARRVPA